MIFLRKFIKIINKKKPTNNNISFNDYENQKINMQVKQTDKGLFHLNRDI